MAFSKFVFFIIIVFKGFFLCFFDSKDKGFLEPYFGKPNCPLVYS